MTNHSWKTTILLVTVFIVGCLSAVPGLLVFWYNETPPQSYSTRIVETPVVQRGGILTVKIVREEIVNYYVANALRSIVDSAGMLTFYDTEPVPIDDMVLTVHIRVPTDARVGTAYYHSKVLWICNPLQRWFPKTVLQNVLTFEITS